MSESSHLIYLTRNIFQLSLNRGIHYIVDRKNSWCFSSRFEKHFYKTPRLQMLVKRLITSSLLRANFKATFVSCNLAEQDQSLIKELNLKPLQKKQEHSGSNTDSTAHMRFINRTVLMPLVTLCFCSKKTPMYYYFFGCTSFILIMGAVKSLVRYVENLLVLKKEIIPR